MTSRTKCDDCGSSDGVKTTDTGTYCFSCGKSTGTYSKEDKQIFTPGESFDDSVFPLEALKILLRAGLTKSIREKYNITYLLEGVFKSSTGKMWVASRKIRVPIGNNQCTLRGVDPNQPKWMHVNLPKYWVLSNQLREAVMVEDPFSAIRLHNAGYDAICLFGTKLFAETHLFILQNYDRIIVWMDDDGPGKHAARVIGKTLAGSMPVLKINGTKEPKLCSDSEITQTVGEALWMLQQHI